VLDALVMLLKDFTLKLKQVRRDIDAQLRSELAAQAAAAKAKVRVSAQDSEHYLVSAVLTKQDADRSAAAARLPGHKVLLSIINCVADLCARNSKADRAGMWLMAFDHLLMERRKCLESTINLSVLNALTVSLCLVFPCRNGAVRHGVVVGGGDRGDDRPDAAGVAGAHERRLRAGHAAGDHPPGHGAGQRRGHPAGRGANPAA
jgi:hypothetical protein